MSKTYIRVRNHERFQHYKRRRPIWVKLFRDLWISPPFITLDEGAKLLYIGLTVIASEEDHIPNNINFLFKRLAIDPDTVEKGVPALVESGLVSIYKKPGRKTRSSKTLAEVDNDLPL